jgi:hypothetical protein
MRIDWMELSQLAVSVGAAFAFDRYQAATDQLPTGQSWLLCVLLVGVGAAWVWTFLMARASDWLAAIRRWSRQR